MNILDLPFNRHVGLSLLGRDDSTVVVLEPTAAHLNHMCTVHAAALYSLAEAASGHFLVQQPTLGEDDITALLRSSEVKYRRPAAGRLFANATAGTDAVSELTEHLTANQRGFLTIQVQILNEAGDECFTGLFRWYVSQQTSSERLVDRRRGHSGAGE